MSNGKNPAASIRQRLLNRSREEKRPFNELLQYYAMERFLYRLCQSPHNSSFVLKGALMLRVWDAPQARPTMDIDMLGRTSNELDAILNQVREILNASVPEDGLRFDANTLQAETITEDADYQGVRVRFAGALSGARVNLQLDIGFGDALVPGPAQANFPTLLDLPAPNLWCYSRESAIAEKFEAMVKLGDLNSRMKDFYDIWLLVRQFDFDSATLVEAVTQTFEHRGTPLPEQLPFSDEFVDLKQTQWQAFHRRLGVGHVPESFRGITAVLNDFLALLINPGENPHKKQWKAPGPWSEQQDG